MRGRAQQRGYLLVAAVILIVVVALLAAALSSMLAGNVGTTVNNLGSMQVFYEAESGIEYGRRNLAQDLEWYRTASDPVTLPAQTLGAGGFTVVKSVPATMLTAASGTIAGTLRVYTTARFPTAGFLQIEDDVSIGSGEFVQYSGVTANTFNVIARSVVIGGVPSVIPPVISHGRSSRVYPVTTLATALAANCTALASINVAAHSKFLGAGTIDIEGEELRYGSSSTSGGTLTLSGVLRCQNTTLAAAHAVGAPVTPILVDNLGVDFEAEMVSTGTLGGDSRVSRLTVQR